MNLSAVYARINYDFPNSEEYHGYHLRDLACVIINDQIMFVLWHKRKPLTRQEVEKQGWSMNMAWEKARQFKDKYMYEKLSNGRVKITGKYTGSAIVLNQEVRKQLLHDLGTHAIIIYDDCSIWAREMSPAHVNWAVDIIKPVIDLRIKNQKYPSGKYLFFNSGKDFKMMSRKGSVYMR